MASSKLLIVLLVIVTVIQCQADECKSYVSINNHQRSAGYILDPKAESSFCDINLRNGWYRFISKAGGTMPDKCPQEFACGTTGSIWADGALPQKVGNVANLTASVRVQGHCKASSWTIRAKKCKENNEEFYIYYLIRPPGCMGYCGGTEKKCPPDFNSPTGFTPGCTKSFPSVEKGPLVFYGVKNNRLIFNCQFKSSDTGAHSKYEVTWYQGTPAKKLPKTDILTGDQRVAIIQNTNKYPADPLFYLGTTISCRVRTWFSYSEDKKSAYKESNHYYAGITVEPKQLHFSVKEGKQPLKLTVKATVPIVCENKFGCQVLVDLGQDNSQNFLDLCTVIFKKGPANQTKSVEVYAKSDFVNDGNKLMLLKVDVLEHIDPVDWNQHRKVPHIKITAEDVKTALCGSTGDPHLRTFDGISYNYYQVGDYVLTKSTCRKFEVHARTWKCGSVSCNCGIAAREGDDVIIVDMCRDRIPRARFASTVEPRDGTSIKRDKNGKRFVISFPSGANVKADVHRWGGGYYMNVAVQVPSDDFECTVGLCGKFDGIRDNDLTDKNGKVWRVYGKGGTSPAFSESWRLPVGDSLFYYKGGEAKCNATRAKYFCTCKENAGHRPTVNCGFTSIVNKPKYIQGTKGWKDLSFPGGEHCGKRRRRSINEDEIILPNDNQLFDYLYDPDPLPNVTISWPTPSGKTRAYVGKYCQDTVMNSEPGKICKRIEDFDFEPFIEQCIEDIQITDNKTFYLSAVRAMQDFCEEIFLKNMTFWEPDPSQNNTFSPPIEMGNTLCPNLCSAQGKCVNGTCICNKGFTSADCSIEKDKGPTVEGISGHGLCDIRKGSGCLKIRVDGHDFIDSTTLKCRVIELQILEDLKEKTSSPCSCRRCSCKSYDLPGKLLSFREVMCELKDHPLKISGHEKTAKGIPHAGYLIYVSNDGHKLSNTSATYTIHDGNCMECQPLTGICKVKRDSCHINGYCFKHGEKNPLATCSKCVPEKSQFEFSKVTSGDCAVKTSPPMETTATTASIKEEESTAKPREEASAVKKGEESSKNVIIIVCSAVGGLLLVAIVIVVVMKMKGRENSPDKLTEMPTPSVDHKRYDAKTFINASYEPETK